MKYETKGIALVAYNGYGDTMVIATDSEELDAEISGGSDTSAPTPDNSASLPPGVYVCTFDAVTLDYGGDNDTDYVNVAWRPATADDLEKLSKLEPASYEANREYLAARLRGEVTDDPPA